MNTNYVRWMILGTILLSNSMSFSTGRKHNQLKTVFHHQVAAGATPASIELGSIVFYLEQEPAIEVRSQKQLPNATEYTFFMPQTVVSSAAKKMVESLKKSLNNDLYRMRIAEASQGGILVTVVCTTPTVGMRYQLFESIKRDKGIVFSFYNNDLIKTLHKEKPVLTTAQNHKDKRIVVDCGHGGKDVGAIGPTGVQEKEVCLTVGIELAGMLRKEGFDVFLTRRNDITVPLDNRTTAANSAKADVFVSIHANAASRPTTRGIETYYLDTALLSEQFSTLPLANSQLIAALDVSTSQQSEMLANMVHTALIKQTNEYMPTIDRKVKKNVSQVLLGTLMPAVLIEVGFLTNPSEEKLLNTPPYQREIARGICNGVVTFAKNNLSHNVASL